MNTSKKFRKGFRFCISFIIILLLSLSSGISQQVPTTIDDFFLPGSQDGQSGNLESPSKCDNCHGGYDITTEPAFNWRGSMMAQAARDPLYFATVAIANQDVKDVGDLCMRCHAPDGWLNGRSIPTDASALNSGDREGVKCDFCHKLVNPMVFTNNPYAADEDYMASTYQQDIDYLSSLSEVPPASANGMYVVDANNAKRGPFVDANAKHKMFYSPFHSDAALCGTCHDVSNPVFKKVAISDGTFEYVANDMGQIADNFSPYEMFPVERTYSEWKMSAYNSANGIYAPQFGGNKDFVSTCQDCHMKDVTAKGANKRGTITRHDMPLHDMTGGNTFIPGMIAQMYPDEVDQAALDAGVERARGMLEKAASMDVTVEGTTVSVKVTNETGHKLPSGYPEGRRIWLNVKAFSSGDNIAYESGEYKFSTGELIHDDEAKIYEVKPGMSSTGQPSFHFALNNIIYSDNRIPPRGFTNANFEAIQSPPVGYTYGDGQYWDLTEYTIPPDMERVEVILYYQTTSKEYVEFLRDENITDDTGEIMWDYWDKNGKSAPEEMNKVVVNLSEPAPEADFDYTVDGLTVTFVDESYNSPTSWLWDFGDGTSSNEQNPVHTFLTEGNYPVSLVVSNSEGTSSPYIENVNLATVVTTDIKTTFISVLEITAKGNRSSGQAVVKVTDLDNNPIEGATVSGSYDGPGSGSFETSSDADGVAIINTKTVKNASSVDWCFTILNVEKEDCHWIETEKNSCGKSGTIENLSNDKGVEISLGQNYPNPFANHTNINFTIPERSQVKIEVYNLSGKLVESLIERQLPPGYHKIELHADSYTNGIYYYRMVAGGKTFVKKMVVNK